MKDKKTEEYDILVGIPTLNEADNISALTKTIDRGLKKYLSTYRAIIVNVDSGSSDNTQNIFLKTKTLSTKRSVLVGGSNKGKGSNVFTMINLAKEYRVKYVCTIDGDILSVKPSWVKNLLNPLILNQADYITPLYRRNRYEGSSTNHFCVPLLETVFGAEIRQPIGGEFAFNRKFINLVAKIDKPRDAHAYGIDIFLTVTAVANNFRIKEVLLGKKVHKPSFGKMVPMFEQIATAMIYLLSKYKGYRYVKCIDCQRTKIGIDQKITKPSNAALKERFVYAVNQIKEIQERESCFSLPANFINQMENNSYTIDKTEWEFILKRFITHTQSKTTLTENEQQLLTKTITSLFLLRVLSFYKEIENLNAIEVESMLKYNIKL